MTIDELAVIVNKIGDNLETLATMTKNGFDQMTEQFARVDKRFETIEQDHENMMLRLDNVAYKFDLKDLEKRVDTLEQKVT